jgi:hypothetical protein
MSGKQEAWPRVNGVGRAAPCVVSVYFASDPSDEQLRALHEALRHTPPTEASAAQAGEAVAIAAEALRTFQRRADVLIAFPHEGGCAITQAQYRDMVTPLHDALTRIATRTDAGAAQAVDEEAAEAWLVRTARKAGPHGVTAHDEALMRLGFLHGRKDTRTDAGGAERDADCACGDCTRPGRHDEDSCITGAAFNADGSLK